MANQTPVTPGLDEAHTAIIATDGLIHPSTDALQAALALDPDVATPPSLALSAPTAGFFTGQKGGSYVDIFSHVEASTQDEGQVFTGFELQVYRPFTGDSLLIGQSNVALDKVSSGSLMNGGTFSITKNAQLTTVSISELSLDAAAFAALIDELAYFAPARSGSLVTSVSLPIVLTTITDSGPAGFNTTVVNQMAAITRTQAINEPSYAYVVTPKIPEQGLAPGVSTAVELELEMLEDVTLPAIVKIYALHGPTMASTGWTGLSLPAGTYQKGYKQTFSVDIKPPIGIDSSTYLVSAVVESGSQTVVPPVAGYAGATLVPVTPNAIPNVDAVGLTPLFVENEPAVSLFDVTSASTNDAGQTFTGATLSVSNITDGKAEILTIGGTDIALVDGAQGSLVAGGSYTVLVMQGQATITIDGLALDDAGMKAWLDAATYQNTSQAPTSGAREISLIEVVDNGSADNTALLTGITATVTVEAVNDAPTFAAPDGGVILIPASNDKLEVATSTVVQPDGKLLIAGYSGGAFSVVRMNADGSLDGTFGNAGKLVLSGLSGTNAQAHKILLQDDGKILVAGTDFTNQRAMVVRLTQDGQLDAGFGDAGKAIISDANYNLSAWDILVDSHGKILLAADSSHSFGNGDTKLPSVFRLNDDGQLDTTFGVDGKAMFTGFSHVKDVRSIALDDDGNILLGGVRTTYNESGFAIFRFTPDGIQDNSFADPANNWKHGILWLQTYIKASALSTMAVLPDGKVLLAGHARLSDDYDTSLMVVRVGTDNRLDTTFGDNGKITLDIGNTVSIHKMLVQPDGKLLVVGTAQNANNDIALVRLNADGTRDVTFGDNGVVTHLHAGQEFGRDVVLLADGKIAVVGYGTPNWMNQFLVARFNADGSIDQGFSPSSLDASLVYTVWNAQTVLDASVSVFDAELAARGHYAGASVTLERKGGASPEDVFAGSGSLALDANAGTVVLDGFVIGSFVQVDGSLTITFNTQATQARIDKALSSLTYQYAGKNPPETAAIVWTFDDGNTNGDQGMGSSKTATGETLITFDLPNPLPTVDAMPVNPDFTEGGNAVALFGDVVADSDDSYEFITSVTIIVSGVADGANEQLLVLGQAIALVEGSGRFNDDWGYTVRLDGDIAKVTLHDMQANGGVLESIVHGMSYQNTSSAPTAGSRAVSLVRVEDSGEDVLEPGLTSTVNIISVNDAPTFAAPIGGNTLVSPDGSLVYVTASALQADGKILVVGHTANAHSPTVVRLLADGSVDAGFGASGGVQGLQLWGFAQSVLPQSDGSILVTGQLAGWLDPLFFAAKLLADGSLDTTFGDDGVAYVPTTGTNLTSGTVGVQPDGSIILTGHHGQQTDAKALVVRLDKNGKLDDGFADKGAWSQDRLSVLDAVVQSDGKILLSGQTFGNAWWPAVVRLNADGSPDTGFGTNGQYNHLQQSAGAATSITLQSDGKIVFLSSYYNGSGNTIDVVRIDATGKLDTDFGAHGKLALTLGANVNAFDLVQQPDGKLVIVGALDGQTMVVRVNSNGTLDTAFGKDGVVLSTAANAGDGLGVLVDAQGRIVVTGQEGQHVVVLRLNADGSRDDTFNPQAGEVSLGGEVTYTYTDNKAVVLDSDVRVFDAELAARGHYEGASITLARQGGFSEDDHFDGGGALVLANGEATLAGVVVGTFSQSSGMLTILFNAGATQARVNQTLSALTYRFDGDTPPANIVIDWTFNDGNTGAQGSGEDKVAVGHTTVVMNAAPTEITLTHAAIDEHFSTEYAVTIGLLGTDDLDATDTFTYAIVGGADKNVFVINGNALQFKAGTVLDFETQSEYTVRVRTTDSKGATYERDLVISLNDVNETPEVAIPLVDKAAAAGKAFTITLPEGSFTDPDADDVLTYRAELSNGEPLPAWLTFNATTLTLSGTAPADAQSLTVKIFAKDSGGLEAEDKFTLTVAQAPQVQSITRVDNDSGATSANTVSFVVTFNTSVQGVDVQDFVLTSRGNVAGSIKEVLDNGTGKQFTVVVENITGEGELRLDLKANDTGIESSVGLPLEGGFNTGEAYIIDTTQPVVTSIHAPADGEYGIGKTLDFTVNLSENVSIDNKVGTPTLVFQFGLNPIDIGGGIDIGPFGLNLSPIVTSTIEAVFVAEESTGTALVFRITVLEGWSPDSLLAVSHIKLNGSNIYDKAGNALELFPDQAPLYPGIILDGIAPDAPTIDNEKYTNDETPVLFGTASDATHVIVTIDQHTVYTVAVIDGKWTLDLGAIEPDEGSAPLSLALNQSNHVVVVARDAAGNVSLWDQQSIHIDTIAPDAPAVMLPEGRTNKATITIDDLEKNATWQYSIDGGKNWLPGEDDKFTLDEGDYAAGQIQVRQIDRAGNVSEVLKTTADVTIDTTPPLDPSVSTKPLTNQLLPTLDGEGEPGSTVMVLVGSAVYATPVNAEGKWTLDLATDKPVNGTLKLKANAVNTIHVAAKDAAGNDSGSVTFKLTIDTTPPPPLSAGFPVIEQTNDVEITVDLSPLEPNAKWQYSLDGGDTWTDGTDNSFMLDEGQYGLGQIVVRQVDAAGNVGPEQANSHAFEIDLTPPAAPLIGSADLTNILAPAITGTAEAGSKVVVEIGGATYTTYAFTGYWAIELAHARPTSGQLVLDTDGDNPVSVTATDAAGNTSEPATQMLTIDTTPPLALTDVVMPKPGLSNENTVTFDPESLEAGARWQYSLNAGASWIDGGDTYSFTLHDASYGLGEIRVRQIDAAGNPGEHVGNPASVQIDTVAPNPPAFLNADLTNAEWPTLSGMGEHGSTITVTVGGSVYSIKMQGVGWELDLASAVPVSGSPKPVLNVNGENTVSITATDAAGNTSEPTEQTLTIDTTDPEAPLGVTLPEGGATNQDIVTVDLGELEDGAIWQYSLDGGKHWVNGDASGTFHLDDGDYQAGDIQVRQIDAAGNKGDAVKTTADVTIDTVSPERPTIDSADLTNSLKPVLSGTAEVGSTVTVYVGDAVYTVSAADGTWTLDLGAASPDEGSPALALNPNGKNPITVEATDAAGNVSKTTKQSLTVDTEAPQAPTGVTLPTGGPTNVNTITVDLKALELDATWQYSLDGGDTWHNGDDETGEFTLPDATYAAGSIQVRQIDAAGNEGDVLKTSTEVVIDTVEPDAPVFTSGKLTNQAKPVLTGTAEAGSTISVLVGGTQYTVKAIDGTWTLNLATALPDEGQPALDLAPNDTHHIVVTATDAAGNTSGIGQQNLTIDTQAPNPPEGIELPSGATNNTEIVIDLKGLEKNATWQYSTDGGDTWHDGKEDRFTVLEGVYAAGTIQIRQIDAAGNVGEALKSTDELNVDLTAPVDPTVTSADLTNAKLPVIHGTAEANSLIVVYIGKAEFELHADAKGVWELDLVKTAPAYGTLALDENGENTIWVESIDAAGNWSDEVPFILTIDTTAPDVPTGVTLPEGGLTNANEVTVDLAQLEKGAIWQYSLDGGTTWKDGDDTGRFTLPDQQYAAGDIQVRQIDAAGNEGTPAQTTAAVEIDATPPLAPTFTSGTLTGNVLPVLSGTAEPGSTVVVEIGGTRFSVATINGKWSLDLTQATPIAGEPGLVLDANGENKISITATDAAGNTSQSTEQTLTIDTTGPDAPLGVTLPEGSPTNVNTITIDLDKLEDGATWQYSLDGGNTWIDGDETGTFTLEDATYTAGSIQVRQIDAAGNKGEALKTSAEVVIDTVEPDAPVFTSGKLTNQAKPVLTGTAEAGSTISVLVGGTQYTVKAIDGTWALDLATALPDEGQPALDLAPNDKHHIVVTATDAAGNTSGIGQQNLTIDTQAPNPPEGIELPSGATNNTEIVIDLKGLEKNATWQYSTDGGDTWHDGKEDRFTVLEGIYAAGTIQIRQIDAAGNVGEALKSTDELNVDLTPPANAVVTSEALSNAALPVIGGTAEADSTVIVYIGQAEFVLKTDAQGVWLLDMAQTSPDWGTLVLDTNGENTFWVEVIDAAGNWSDEVAFTLTIDTTAPDALTGVTLPEGGATNVNEVTVDLGSLEAGATWEYRIGDSGTWIAGNDEGTFVLPDGTYAAGDIQVRQVDAAGNKGAIVQTESEVVIDTVAPEAPTVGNATLTSSPTPTLSGRAEDGSLVTIVVGGATYTTVAQNGAWQLNLASAKPVDGTLALNLNGANAISVTARDAAGNVSDAGAQTLTVDTTPPAPLTLSFTASPAGWVIGVANLEAGASWQYQVGDGAWTQGSGASVTVPLVAYPAGAILVRQMDPAGNVSMVAGNPKLDPVTDADGDGLDDDIENGVPGMEGGQQGDGNGDGIPDVEQADVTSLPWIQTPDGKVRYVTLSNDSGLTQEAVRTANIDNASLPAALTLPLGGLVFTVRDVPENGIVNFSVFLDADVPVNGYWKQVDGHWVNIATAITSVGGKTRIDFQIEDGGMFDADGVRNGVIVDPGAPGWFEGNPMDTDGDQIPDIIEIGLGLNPGVKDNDVFARDDLFVMQLYRDALGREADEDGLVYWTGQLDDGMSRKTLLDQVLASTEAQQAEPLARLTLGLLERAPETAEWATWRDGLADGQSIVELADAFVLAHYDQVGDAAFIDQLYADALSRDADAAGRDYWVQALGDGSSRGEVALHFVQTDEVQQAQGDAIDVALLYAGLLGRGADTEGLAYWTDALAHGATVADLAIAIVGSAEYHDRFLPAGDGSESMAG